MVGIPLNKGEDGENANSIYLHRGSIITIIDGGL